MTERVRGNADGSRDGLEVEVTGGGAEERGREWRVVFIFVGLVKLSFELSSQLCCDDMQKWISLDNDFVGWMLRLV